MSKSLRIELVTGLMTGGLGLLVLAFVLFGPTYRYTHSEASGRGQTEGWASLWQLGVSERAMAFLVVMLACVLGVALGAYLHGRKRIDAGLPLLWIAAVLLTGGMVIGVASIGCFLVPLVLLALTAAIAGSLARA